MQTEAVVESVLLDADVADLMPAPVAAAPAGLGHSRVLTAEQVARARSSPHLRLLRSILRVSRERSQSGATSSVAQPAPRPPHGEREGSDESSH